MDQVIGHYNLEEIGHKLKAVTNHLEQSMIRAGHKIEGEKAGRIKEWRALADKLIEGGHAETKQINQALAKLNQEIERLGQEVRQRHPQAPPVRGG
jgi:ubiquinone biosynthesis protein UbiJ